MKLRRSARIVFVAIFFAIQTVGFSPSLTRAATIAINEPNPNSFSTGTLTNVSGTSALSLASTPANPTYSAPSGSGSNPGPSPAPISVKVTATGYNEGINERGSDMGGNFNSFYNNFSSGEPVGSVNDPGIDQYWDDHYARFPVSSYASYTIMGSATYGLYFTTVDANSLACSSISDFGYIGPSSMSTWYNIASLGNWPKGTGWQYLDIRNTLVSRKSFGTVAFITDEHGYGNPEGAIYGSTTSYGPKIQFQAYNTFDQYASNGNMVTWENKGGLVSGDKFRVYYAPGTGLTASQIEAANTYVDVPYNVTSTSLNLGGGSYSTVIVEEQYVGTTAYAGATSNVQTVTVATPTYVSGKYGQGLSFSNGIGVTFPSSAISTSEGTVEAWVNPSVAPGTNMIIVDLAGTGNNGLILGVDTTGKFYMQAGTGSGTVRATSNTAMTQNTWYHVAGSWTTSGVSIYVNGSKEGTASGTSSVTLTGTSAVGFQVSPASNYFNGTVDDFRISSMARSDGTISSDYKSGQALPVDEYTAYLLNFDTNLNAQFGGSRISPSYDIFSSPQTNISTYNISWVATLSTGQSVALYTNLSLDGGSSWGGWQLASNGGSIAGITSTANLKTAKLQLKEVLTSTGGAGSPTLSSVTANVNSDTPYLTFNVSPSSTSLIVNPVSGKTAVPINLGIQTNIFNSNYAVYIYEDQQPKNAVNGQVLPYISAGPGQANGFIASQSITQGFGYTVEETGGSPIVPSGFNNGNSYTSLSTSPEQFMSGNNTTATINDSATLTLGAFADYLTHSGTYSNNIVFRITQQY